MTSTSKRYCSVPQCGNYISKDISIHYFPKDIELQNKWKSALKITKKITPYLNVCSVHFLPSDYYQTKTPNKRGILKHGVIPTQNLPLMHFDSSIKKYRKNVKDTLHHREAYVENDRETMEHSTTKTNYENFEEIYIKEEPLDETSLDREFYENILQNGRTEECTINNDEQSDNNDIGKTENSKRFYCAKCNKCFKRYSILKVHMKIHKEIKEFECPTCFKYFMQNSHLQEHMKIHSKIKKHICTICNKKFTQSSGLYAHMKVHSEIKNHECTKCNKLFAHSNNLSRHMKIHAEIKDYKCPTCNKLFTQKANLKSHMELHSKIKEYKCTICNKEFARYKNLSRHVKIHSAVKEYKCTICNKLFAQSHGLSHHMKIHNKIKEYKCTICYKEFAQHTGLFQHMKSHTRTKIKHL